MSAHFDPKQAAMRYRIWAYCEPRGWDVTFREVADALDISAQAVGAIAKHAGWAERFRVADRLAKRENWNATNSPGIFARHLARDIVAGRIGVDA